MEGQELIEKVNWLVYYAEKRKLNADEKALVQKRIDRINQEIQFEKNEIIRLERALAKNTPTSSEQLATPAVSKAKRTVKRSDNATAYNDGYSKGYEDALIDAGKSV